MKVVYVSGCLGFIGAYVTQACLDKGWHVYGIDKCTYASNISNLDRFKSYKNFRFEKKDICDLDRMFECDYFINTAAETHVGNSIARNDEFLSTNILGVSNILNLIRRSNIDTNNLPTFFLGTSPVITEEQISYIKEMVDNFMSKYNESVCINL